MLANILLNENIFIILKTELRFIIFSLYWALSYPILVVYVTGINQMIQTFHELLI